MDVACVQDVHGVYHYTEFYVKFKNMIVDQSALAFVGLGVDGLIFPSTSNAAPSSSGIDSRQSDSESGPDVLRMSMLAEKDAHNSFIPPTEPLWVTFYVNGKEIENIKAYIGLGQLLYFYNPETQQSALSPSQTDFSHFRVHMGRNKVHCIHTPSGSSIRFDIYLYNLRDNLVVMDIDGTITRSDLTGYIQTVYLGLYSYIHDGIVDFLHTLQTKHHLKFIYLTSRPMGHRKETINFLKGVQRVTGRGGERGLPPGPLFTAKTRLMVALYKEVVTRETASIKASMLQQVVDIFRRGGDIRPSPIVAGWGNKV
ncbi:hypothetical protein EON63_22760 [archaeon]|nr:MAG: hypothetical protein EON63_22760 [archaeon]